MFAYGMLVWGEAIQDPPRLLWANGWLTPKQGSQGLPIALHSVSLGSSKLRHVARMAKWRPGTSDVAPRLLGDPLHCHCTSKCQPFQAIAIQCFRWRSPPVMSGLRGSEGIIKTYWAGRVTWLNLLPELQVSWCPYRPGYLASCDTRGVVYLWDMDVGTRPETEEPPVLSRRPELSYIYAGHAQEVNDLSWCPNFDTGAFLLATASSRYTDTDEPEGQYLQNDNVQVWRPSGIIPWLVDWLLFLLNRMATKHIIHRYTS